MSEEKKENLVKFDTEIYSNEKEKKWATDKMELIAKGLETRENPSIIFNNIPYSTSYEYNRRKAVNFAPAKGGDDSSVSMGMVHEKVIGFCSRLLSSAFKSEIQANTLDGKSIQNLGEFFELSTVKSFELEDLRKKVALIYWELYSQGNAFAEEMWEVRNVETRIPVDNKGSEIKDIDYTYEFLDGLTYKSGEMIQTRRAVVRLHDGRSLIVADPELNELQDQDWIVIEEVMSKSTCDELYGSLKRYPKVPTDRQSVIDNINSANTLFDAKRIKNMDSQRIVQRYYSKAENRFNIAVNGIFLLPMDTTLLIFHPRGNYPVTNFNAERVAGSLYSRSIPAKTKFNADYVDWILAKLAIKFEQGIEPAIISNGKITIGQDLFKPRHVTTNVSRGDFEKVDPENKGVTGQEFSFLNLIKEIIESQTLNPTSSGQVEGTTAFEISKVDQAQTEKLAYMLDGVINGFIDLYARRCETIESKYTIKQRETIVDGKKISVYPNFVVNVDGISNVVEFDDAMGNEDFDVEGKQNELFKKSFEDKKAGRPTSYYLINPIDIRERKYSLLIKGRFEKLKDTQLEMMSMWDEFTQVINTFGERVNIETLQKEYLKVSGRPDDMFIPQEAVQLQEMEAGQEGGAGYNTGSFGKPTLKEANNNEGIRR